MIPVAAFAKPVILLSYYDPFANSKFNNSERVATAVADALKNENTFEIKLCALPTVFDRAYAAVENCKKDLASDPVMYLGLGEYGCSMKLETMGRNLDRNLKSGDNAGNLRNQIIIHEGEKILSFNFPAPDMYCALNSKSRGSIEISNNAGSFVCNNTAYQFAHYYPEIPSGFIHVPANNCKGLEARTREAVDNLTTMIRTGMRTIVQNGGEGVRLPLTKKDLEPLRNNKADQCKAEFFKRMKSADEKTFLNLFTQN